MYVHMQYSADGAAIWQLIVQCVLSAVQCPFSGASMYIDDDDNNNRYV